VSAQQMFPRQIHRHLKITLYMATCFETPTCEYSAHVLKPGRLICRNKQHSN
jgi:glutaredoxin-related protein